MATMDSDTLIYLYGIVPEDAPEPPLALRGLEDEPVQLLRAAGVAALVGEVPAALYTEEALNARLANLAWIGDRGAAHERVLTWYADRGPVIPLAPFSLHQSEARVRERIEEESARFLATLERLRGRREWGLRMRRDDARLAAHLEELSPRLRALAQEIESAAPGRRYLLEKKRETLRAEELRAAAAEAVQRVYEAVRGCAEHAALLPLAAAAATGGGEGRGVGGALILDAVFLVEEAEYPAFQQRVTEAGHRYGPLGFELEFTGPWPPYHFAHAERA